MNDMKNPPPRELSTEEIEKVFKTVEIPACPAIVVEAMKEAQKDVPDIVRLAKTISADVGMSAITIKLANSSLFRAGAAVTNVRKALERLGTMNVVCVVVASALRSSMKGPSSSYIDRFWSKNSALALAAGMIARRHYGISPDAAYTYALFHDAGIPLMLRRFPEYERVLEGCQASGKLLIGAEDSYFPCTHPVIGSLLVRNWGLPANLIQAIRLHHEADVYDLPDTTLPGGSLSLIACVHVAEHMISELLGEKDYEVGDHLYERGIAHLGIAQEDMEQLREDIVAAMNESKH
ncbi:MAG: HDOD domain-containing protein [Betaproteobacteria bacterium]|nr:HDOD domain-containing protein [Betaproteobacteria bacterium]